jgi:hypothetical protein
MKKSLRVAVLTTVLAISAAPVFADPGGSDPPPPPPTNNLLAATVAIVTSVLSSIGL